MNTQQKYLITGPGYLGKQLIKRLVEQGFKNLRVIARNEGNLIKLKEEYPFIEIVPGDISNAAACEKACEGVEGIFHLAAQKHVGLAEMNVARTVLSNIGGTMNILECTLRHKPEFIIGISTDKAAQVKGIYGASKLIQEGLFREFESFNPQTKYRTVRYGNVWKSPGSFITKWEPKMRAGEEIILTDPEATRFFWTVEQAVELIFDCLNEAVDSTPFTPKMKSAKMGVVLDACMEVFGKCPLKITGLQKGENLSETIDGITYSGETEQFTKEEFINTFLIERK